MVVWTATRTELASISSALATFWGGQLSVLVTKWLQVGKLALPDLKSKVRI